MEVGWAPASADAGLWAADVVAGVVTFWLDGRDRYWQLLEHHITLLDTVDVSAAPNSANAGLPTSIGGSRRHFCTPGGTAQSTLRKFSRKPNGVAGAGVAGVGAVGNRWAR
jgi:hypothetical protein